MKQAHVEINSRVIIYYYIPGIYAQICYVVCSKLAIPTFKSFKLHHYLIVCYFRIAGKKRQKINAPQKNYTWKRIYK